MGEGTGIRGTRQMAMRDRLGPIFLAFKMKRAMSQEYEWPPEGEKGKGMDCPLEPPKRNATLITPDFSPLKKKN